MKVDLAEELRRIIKWSLRPDELLQGARTRRTPDGLFPAEVIRVEPEEDIELPSTAVSMEMCYPLAIFDGIEPVLLRDEASTTYLDCDGMEYAVLRGRYCIANHTIVFFVEFDQQTMQFFYIVCHPDFAVAHSVRTFKHRRQVTDKDPVTISKTLPTRH